MVQALGAFCLDGLLVLLTVTLAGGLGRKWMPLSNLRAWERTALQAAAGFGILSLFWFFLGLLPSYYGIIAWLALAGGLLIFRKNCLAWLAEIKQGFAEYGKLRVFDKALLLLVILLIGGQILLAAAPAVKYDALSYHLQLPKLYMEQHRLVFASGNPYWGHPQLGEMLFTWMGLLHRFETAALLNASWGILLVMGVSTTVQRLAGSLLARQDNDEDIHNAEAVRAGLAAAVVLLSGSTFRYLLGWSYVDLLAAWMGWAVLVCALQILREHDEKWMLWVGLFSGFAIGIKWTAGIIALAVFPYLFFIRKRSRLSLRFWMLGGLLAVLAVLPWLVKNYAATGNPLYPYLLPTQWIDAQRLEAASSFEQPLAFGQSLLFPVTSTLLGWDSAAGYGADLGPLLLLLCIPGLWALRKEDTGRLIGVCLALCWGMIVLGSLFFNHLHQTRLYFVLLPAAVVSAGLGWVYLSRLRMPVFRVSSLLNVLLLMVMGFMVMQDASLIVRQSPAGVVLGLETRADYLDRTLGWYAPAMRALHELPAGSKTLMLWEGRGLYAPENTSADVWIDRWRVDYWRNHTPELILESWLDAGYTHLLFYKNGAEAIHAGGSPLDESGWETLDALLAMLPQPVSFGDAYWLFVVEK